MIPYQDMSLQDFCYYWGDSYVLMRETPTSPWQPAIYNGTAEDGADNSVTLDRRASEGLGLKWYLPDTQETKVYPDTHQFESDDWITYAPALGYILDEKGKLLLVRCTCPRRRQKGISASRITYDVPIDADAVGAKVYRLLEQSLPNVDALVVARGICARMNSPVSEGNWRSAVLTSLESGAAAVLSYSTAFLPEKGGQAGYLLVQGAAVAKVEATSLGSLVVTILPNGYADEAALALRHRLAGVTIANKEAK